MRIAGVQPSTPFTDCSPHSAAGNLVQLSLAIARLFATSDRTFHKGDQQALTSLISFLLGSSLGRIGDRVGPKKRWWLMTSTFIMALLTMAASLCAHFSGDASVAECVKRVSRERGGNVRGSLTLFSVVAGRRRYRTEASWSNAKGMAALGFASASLGLQVRSIKYSLSVRRAKS